MCWWRGRLCGEYRVSYAGSGHGSGELYSLCLRREDAGRSFVVQYGILYQAEEISQL